MKASRALLQPPYVFRFTLMIYLPSFNAADTTCTPTTRNLHLISPSRDLSSYKTSKRSHQAHFRMGHRQWLEAQTREDTNDFIWGQKRISKIQSDSLDPVLLNGIPTPFTDSVKNLGVIMDKSLSGDLWAKQICPNTFALINRFYRCDGL